MLINLFFHEDWIVIHGIIFIKQIKPPILGALQVLHPFTLAFTYNTLKLSKKLILD